MSVNLNESGDGTRLVAVVGDEGRVVVRRLSKDIDIETEAKE